MKTSLTITLLILSALPVKAAQCPYGQILRVHLGECVGWHSKLAQAYVKFPMRVSHRKEYFQNISLPVPPPSPPLQWNKMENFPQIDLTANLICAFKMPDKDYGSCLLKIEMEKERGGAANK